MAADPTDVADDRSGDYAPEAIAVQELYERHAARVYSFCLHQLGNREEAEDATQSTFLNAFRGLQRGITPVSETAWLLAIARNVCLTRVRSTVRRRRLEAPRDLHTLQDVVPARAAAGGDELLWLEDALSGLPANQRRAILLREWQGLSYDEIAADLGTTHGAVETLIFRGRRSLAQRLEIAPRRRRVAQRVGRWVDIGAGLGWAKALLAGGTAKAVATAAVVATVAVAGGAPLRHDEPPAVVTAGVPPSSGSHAAAPPAAFDVLGAKATKKPPVKVAAKRFAAVRRVGAVSAPASRSGSGPPSASGGDGTRPVAAGTDESGADSQPAETTQPAERTQPAPPSSRAVRGRGRGSDPENKPDTPPPPATEPVRETERGGNEQQQTEQERKKDQREDDEEEQQDDEQRDREDDDEGEDDDEAEDQDEDETEEEPEEDETDEDDDDDDDDDRRGRGPGRS